jgi:cytochrome P450
MRTLADFDPFAPEVVQEPHAFFAALRREAPLYRLPNGAYYLISRYRDVRAAAMNPEVYSSKLVAVLMQGREHPGRPELLALEGGGTGQVDALAIADPPAHARQRKLSNRAFSMRRVAALEPAIRALAESLVAAILPRGGARWSSADWMREVAVPLPITVIAGLIGLPGEDIPQLKRWSDAGIALLSGVNTPEQLAEHGAQAMQMAGYFSNGHFRIVRRDTEVAGTPLPRASRVMLHWGAANRDADEFPNPDAIDLARRNAKAHLGFGIGIHHCIGAALARLEARVVLETLFARTSALRRADGKIAHVPSLLVRCLAALPVEIAS